MTRPEAFAIIPGMNKEQASIIVRAVGVSIVVAGGLWVYQLGNSEVASRSVEAVVYPSGVTPTTEPDTTAIVEEPVLDEGEPVAPVTASEPVAEPAPEPEPTPEPVAPTPPAGTYQSPETNDSTYTINVGR